jgi:hypothetical protein
MTSRQFRRAILHGKNSVKQIPAILVARLINRKSRNIRSILTCPANPKPFFNILLSA